MAINPNDHSITNVRKILIADRKDSNDLRAEQVRASLNPAALVEELHQLCEESKICEIEDLERLKFRAGVVTTILKKCLPDLRSLEVKEKEKNYSRLIIEMKTPHNTSTSDNNINNIKSYQRDDDA
jgi:hypothetical protein